jgi:hypothetical protein
LKLKSVLLFTFLCLLNIASVAQTSSNLDLIKTLINLSVKDIKSNIPGDAEKVYLEFNSPSDYSSLKFSVINSFDDNGFDVLYSGENTDLAIEYTLSDASILYTDSFRDGLFGDFKLVRESVLEGNYIIIPNGEKLKTFEFEKSIIDTINYDQLTLIENRSYQFTVGNAPDEPFFSNILEPVVAIGATAVAVYLFFSVRSK